MTIRQPSDHLDIIACGGHYLNPDLCHTRANEREKEKKKTTKRMTGKLLVKTVARACTEIESWQQ